LVFSLRARILAHKTSRFGPVFGSSNNPNYRHTEKLRHVPKAVLFPLLKRVLVGRMVSPMDVYVPARWGVAKRERRVADIAGVALA